MTLHQRNKIIALLKSIAIPCDVNPDNFEHSWRKCRHCLAVTVLEYKWARKAIAELIQELET